jgi:hypothetical protein
VILHCREFANALTDPRIEFRANHRPVGPLLELRRISGDGSDAVLTVTTFI